MRPAGEQFPGPLDVADRLGDPAAIGRQPGQRQPGPDVGERSGIADEGLPQQVLAGLAVSPFQAQVGLHRG